MVACIGPIYSKTYGFPVPKGKADTSSHHSSQNLSSIKQGFQKKNNTLSPKGVSLVIQTILMFRPHARQ